MKIQAFILLFVLISCQKPKPVIQTKDTASVNKTETINKQENISKIDTISIAEIGEKSTDNYILAYLLDEKMDKDSIVTRKYKLDFYQNKIKTVSSKITINLFQKGSEWSAHYGLGNENDNSSPFIQIDFGYPACDYTQNHYLYHLKNNDLQLVYEWYTMSGSSGSWVEFENSKENPETIYCKTVAFETDDNDENMGTVTHSDSTVFRLIGNKWKSQLLSAKDKNYFEKKMSFDEFQKQ
ncbi:hypothetical protein IRZ71_12130 [Flavobacterium sp. ANB]|uniref:hypothetical protein n=1 Tax=unclassified Flavobacterium TaxID=196869 RepID=UPI0012B907A8|nr:MULTISPECIES: hypothetical protein [unclassified Flavobacterium]MBF4517101.1 hypothetical protein [Flavobacterium sp. ANB]MTD71838.1 hypothetical protein [Flavobacterium sp. LC2016-13]